MLHRGQVDLFFLSKIFYIKIVHIYAASKMRTKHALKHIKEK